MREINRHGSNCHRSQNPLGSNIEPEHQCDLGHDQANTRQSQIDADPPHDDIGIQVRIHAGQPHPGRQQIIIRYQVASPLESR